MNYLPQICFLLLALLAIAKAEFSTETSGPKPIVATANPDPQTLPTLAVWMDEKSTPGRKLPMVSAAFPNPAGFVCDAWCYESAEQYGTHAS